MKLLVMLFGLFLLASAQAATYTSGMFVYPPWGDKDSNGAFKGILVDMMRGIFSQKPLEGMNLTFKEVPLRREGIELKNGTVDMVVALQNISSLKAYALPTVPFLKVPICAYTNSDDPRLAPYLDGTRTLSFHLLTSMGLHAAAIDGDLWVKKYLVPHKGNMKLTYMKKPKLQVLWLLHKRGELIFSNTSTVGYVLKQLRADSSLPSSLRRRRIVPLPVPLKGKKATVVLFINKRSPLAQNLDKVNEAIALTLQSQKKEGQQNKACTQPL